jgi:hypothetical protein
VEKRGDFALISRERAFIRKLSVAAPSSISAPPQRAGPGCLAALQLLGGQIGEDNAKVIRRRRAMFRPGTVAKTPTARRRSPGEHRLLVQQHHPGALAERVAARVRACNFLKCLGKQTGSAKSPVSGSDFSDQPPHPRRSGREGLGIPALCHAASACAGLCFAPAGCWTINRRLAKLT